ncbi:MAG: hypothetical protein BWY63_00386 [Chloroflexi bacterium ADurb.Bin360]|nr:MAG: hypothetical protein BWY63_00386 [Chloroflexi bacterium ADurb.Bin360]
MEHTQRLVERIIHNLDRQLGALRYEMRIWQEHAQDHLKDHAHQLEEVRLWTEALLPESLDELRSLHGAPAFFEKSYELQALISGVLEVWEYYRDRFELNFGPLTRYQAWISGAEWVAADCYQTAMEHARQLDLEISTPRSTSPLLQLESQGGLPQSVANLRMTSPVTLPRQFAPVPIIVLPANLMANSWGFLALHHEVGHDVMADLGWSDAALAEYGMVVLKPRLAAAGVPPERALHWCGWLSELYADFFALWLVGPAFAGYMLETLALPKVEVQRRSERPSRYPAPFLRIHILLKVLESHKLKGSGSSRTSSKSRADYQKRVQGYLETWKALYDADDALSAAFAGFLEDLQTALPLLLDTPMLKAPFGEKIPFRDLCLYGLSEHDVVTRAAGDWAREPAQGTAVQIAPRLIAGAARFAFEELFTAGAADADPSVRLETLQNTVLEAIQKNKPSLTLKAFDAELGTRSQALAARFREALLEAYTR